MVGCSKARISWQKGGAEHSYSAQVAAKHNKGTVTERKGPGQM